MCVAKRMFLSIPVHFYTPGYPTYFSALQLAQDITETHLNTAQPEGIPRRRRRGGSLVVVGSTAVCPNTGARVGKGEGFAELEWGILSQQGNLDASKVLVVTTVHDCQVFDGGIEEPWKSLMNDLREEGDTVEAGGAETPFGTLTQHDVPVDLIITPTRIIRVPNRLPKPSGVYWDLLSPQKLAQIRVLQELKKRTEAELGETLPSGPDEVLPPTASRKGRGGRGRGGRGRGGRSGRGRGRGGGRAGRS